MIELNIEGVTLDYLGGTAPVQGEGRIDDLRWYFRARGNEWRLGIGKDDDDAVSGTIFEYGEPYGTEVFDASYLPLPEAVEFIRQAIALYRKQ